METPTVLKTSQIWLRSFYAIAWGGFPTYQYRGIFTHLLSAGHDVWGHSELTNALKETYFSELLLDQIFYENYDLSASHISACRNSQNSRNVAFIERETVMETQLVWFVALVVQIEIRLLGRNILFWVVTCCACFSQQHSSWSSTQSFIPPSPSRPHHIGAQTSRRHLRHSPCCYIKNFTRFSPTKVNMLFMWSHWICQNFWPPFFSFYIRHTSEDQASTTATLCLSLFSFNQDALNISGFETPLTTLTSKKPESAYFEWTQESLSP